MLLHVHVLRVLEVFIFFFISIFWILWSVACVFRPPSSAEAPAEQPPPPPAKEGKKEGKGKVDKDAPDGMHEYLVILADHHLLDMPIESLQVRSRRFVTDVVGGMLQ